MKIRKYVLETPLIELVRRGIVHKETATVDLNRRFTRLVLDALESEEVDLSELAHEIDDDGPPGLPQKIWIWGGSRCDVCLSLVEKSTGQTFKDDNGAQLTYYLSNGYPLPGNVLMGMGKWLETKFTIPNGRLHGKGISYLISEAHQLGEVALFVAALADSERKNEAHGEFRGVHKFQQIDASTGNLEYITHITAAIGEHDLLRLD